LTLPPIADARQYFEITEALNSKVEEKLMVLYTTRAFPNFETSSRRFSIAAAPRQRLISLQAAVSGVSPGSDLLIHFHDTIYRTHARFLTSKFINYANQSAEGISHDLQFGIPLFKVS
jgi:hypothetical protein